MKLLRFHLLNVGTVFWGTFFIVTGLLYKEDNHPSSNQIASGQLDRDKKVTVIITEVTSKAIQLVTILRLTFCYNYIKRNENPLLPK